MTHLKFTHASGDHNQANKKIIWALNNRTVDVKNALYVKTLCVL